jgi:hypothetical protein
MGTRFVVGAMARTHSTWMSLFWDSLSSGTVKIPFHEIICEAAMNCSGVGSQTHAAQNCSIHFPKDLYDRTDNHGTFLHATCDALECCVYHRGGCFSCMGREEVAGLEWIWAARTSSFWGINPNCIGRPESFCFGLDLGKLTHLVFLLYRVLKLKVTPSLLISISSFR